MNWLRYYLDKKGMKPAELARLMGIHRQTLGKQIDKESLPVKWAERIAPVLSLSSSELLFGPKSEPTVIKLVPIRGDVAASRWFEMEDVGELRYDPVPVVPGKYGYLEQFGFRVAGLSMDKAGIPDGAYAICVNYFEARTRITDGDKVIVERKHGHLIERTVKQIVVTGKGFELWPRSSDPRFQSPLVVLSADEAHADDGTEIEVTGLVIGVFVPM